MILSMDFSLFFIILLVLLTYMIKFILLL
jgi:hypothetical protein